MCSCEDNCESFIVVFLFVPGLELVIIDYSKPKTVTTLS